jgi:hypothetical protein
MNSFILKIFFSGLIAFVPGKNGVTVLLLDTQTHHLAGGAANAEHAPLLLARAANCKGDCARSNTDVATFLYPDVPAANDAAQALGDAIDGGTVWQLSGSNLSLDIPKDGIRLVHVASADGKSVPDSEAERADFRWVPSLKEIDPQIGPIDPRVFSRHPPKGLIVARLRLTSGELSTYSLIQVQGNVVPIDFRPMAADGQSGYLRAAANWVEARIVVPGDHLTLSEKNFETGKKRQVTLSPHDGVVELAVLNITSPVPSAPGASPQPGMHFQQFWELAANPAITEKRAVPQLSRVKVPQRSFDQLHSDDDTRKSLLLKKVFPASKSPYDQILCPMSQYP